MMLGFYSRLTIQLLVVMAWFNDICSGVLMPHLLLFRSLHWSYCKAWQLKTRPFFKCCMYLFAYMLVHKHKVDKNWWFAIVQSKQNWFRAKDDFGLPYLRNQTMKLKAFQFFMNAVTERFNSKWFMKLIELYLKEMYSIFSEPEFC